MKSKRKILVNKLDRIFSRYIRARDKRCVLCGSTYVLECGHYITRSAWPVRWDEVNAHAQCRECNSIHEINDTPYKIWFLEKYGEKILQDLTYKSNQIRKYTLTELEDLIIYFSERIKIYE